MLRTMISFFMCTFSHVVSDPLPGLRNLRLLGMGAVHARERAQANATDLGHSMHATSTKPAGSARPKSSTTRQLCHQRRAVLEQEAQHGQFIIPVALKVAVGARVFVGPRNMRYGMDEKALDGLDVWPNSDNLYVSVGPRTKEAFETLQCPIIVDAR